MTDSKTRFHIFCYLPTELRLKIWSFALADTNRVVEIKCKKGIGLGNKRYVKSFSSNAQVPVLMSVNRESRYETLAIYQPYFKTKLHPTGIYVAFDRDTVFFPEGVIGYLEEPEREGIQSMILELSDYAYFGHYNIDTLRSMRKLKTLELKSEKGSLSNWDHWDKLLTVMNDLTEEGELHPEWEMPPIRIVPRQNGETLRLGNAH